MKIPLGKRLKKRRHLEVALLQDELVELLYEIEPTIVLHGGTAIWRCYQGNRFSEDLDFYCKNIQKIDEAFVQKTKSRGLHVGKYKKTSNLVFSKISNQAEVQVEINFSTKKNSVVASYERVDGSFIDVLVLPPEAFILEKISAYANRRFVRDLYDIYHLGNYVKDEKVHHGVMQDFLTSLQPPVDELNLKTIVYSGAIPSFEQIVDALKRRWP